MNERDNIIDWVTQVDMAFLKRTEPWNMFDKYEAFADLIRADEREAIAQMFEGAPALIPFAQNDKGGCMICGFTPKLAMEAIRARGNT